jgi:hypothetical protein
MSDAGPDNVVPFPQPDREQIRQFVEVMFRRADKDTFVNIQAFVDIKSQNEAFEYSQWRAVCLNEGIDAVVDEAMRSAQRCAASKKAVVFCPPVCTFSDRSGRSNAENLANGLCIVAEIDGNPGENQKKIQALLGPATLIVESGGMDGAEPKVHLYWVLFEPTREQKEHEKLRLVRELVCKYIGEGADKTAKAVVHAMRWPGSLHKKNPKDVRLARIVGGQPERTIKLDDALNLLQEALGWVEVGEVHKSGDLTSSIAKLASALEVYKNTDETEWEPWNNTGMALFNATERSAEGKALWSAWSATSVKDDPAATAKRWEDYKKSPPDRIGAGSLFYWARQIDPNWLPPSELIAEVNREYALVLAGNKTVVLREGVDVDDRPEWRLITVGAFKQWMATKNITIEGKKPQRVPLAEHWLHHPQRRQYEGVLFAPKREVTRHFNLWRGWAVAPGKGNCDLFLEHLKNNAASAEKVWFEWIIAWFADIVQNPTHKPGTSLVFRGKPGVGKTKIFEVFGSLMGEHYVLAPEPRYIVGRFNSHLTSCLLLFADEGFWAGDKAAEGKLRDLVTGGHHFIEFKGVEPIRVNNYIRLGVVSQHDWVVPASFNERRFAVFDMSDAHKQDYKYFAAIDEQMNKGGRSALLWHLLNEVDIGTVNLREIPKTKALFEQKVAGLTIEQGWWLETLQRGDLPGDVDAKGICPVEWIYWSYLQHAEMRGSRQQRSIQTGLGMFLHKCVPGLERKRETFTWHYRDVRDYVYHFPSLNDCREAFAKHVGQPIEWGDKDAWASNKVIPDMSEGEPRWPGTR